MFEIAEPIGFKFGEYVDVLHEPPDTQWQMMEEYATKKGAEPLHMIKDNGRTDYRSVLVREERDDPVIERFGVRLTGTAEEWHTWLSLISL